MDPNVYEAALAVAFVSLLDFPDLSSPVLDLLLGSSAIAASGFDLTWFGSALTLLDGRTSWTYR